MTKTTKKAQDKKIIWKLEKRKIEDLKPHPKNPRHFTESGMADLENSIKSIGMAQPINISQDNVILSGHARIKKLQQMGYDEVDVYVPDRELTSKQEEEVVIRMNANEAGEWDYDKLANEFEFPDLSEWGLEIPGIEEEQAETIGDDEVPDEPIKAITVRGDLYELGDHILLCGDSSIVSQLDNLIQNKEIDLLLTDPPYGIGYGGSMKLGQKKHGWKQLGEKVYWIGVDDDNITGQVVFIESIRSPTLKRPITYDLWLNEEEIIPLVSEKELYSLDEAITLFRELWDNKQITVE